MMGKLGEARRSSKEVEVMHIVNAPNATELYSSKRSRELFFNKKFKRHTNTRTQEVTGRVKRGGGGGTAALRHSGVGPWVEGGAGHGDKTHERERLRTGGQTMRADVRKAFTWRNVTGVISKGANNRNEAFGNKQCPLAKTGLSE